MIGRIEGGQLEVVLAEGDCQELEVWGADRGPIVQEREDGGVRCRFRERPLGGTPQAIRFRLILAEDDEISIRSGAGFWLSAVGEGRGHIRGAGGLDGVFSLNGERFASLPDDGLSFTLAANVSG